MNGVKFREVRTGIEFLIKFHSVAIVTGLDYSGLEFVKFNAKYRVSLIVEVKAARIFVFSIRTRARISLPLVTSFFVSRLRLSIRARQCNIIESR